MPLAALLLSSAEGLPDLDTAVGSAGSHKAPVGGPGQGIDAAVPSMAVIEAARGDRPRSLKGRPAGRCNAARRRGSCWRGLASGTQALSCQALKLRFDLLNTGWAAAGLCLDHAHHQGL